MPHICKGVGTMIRLITRKAPAPMATIGQYNERAWASGVAESAVTDALCGRYAISKREASTWSIATTSRVQGT